MENAFGQELTWRQGLAALGRVWKPLLVYQLVMSLFAAVVLSPLMLTLSYRLIALSGESVLGNVELARFLVSPRGLLALILGGSVALGILFVEYAGLMLLADAALRGVTLTIRELIWRMLGSAKRLYGLALFSTCLALAAIAPFLGLAALAYWLLLGATDINFYLQERPPRFWLALAIGGVLATGMFVTLAALFLRWAFAVPACVLDGRGWRAALRLSAQRMRGRTMKLLVVLGGWQLLHYALLGGVVLLLDVVHARVLPEFSGRLMLLIWSTVAWLLVDAALLELVGALFAIGTAAVVAYEYEQARRAAGESARERDLSRMTTSVQQSPPSRAKLAVLGLALVGPLATLIYALALSQEFVEQRPALVTAHRAGPKSAPENSLAALRLAIAARADYVEIDVQQTSDGEVVLLHDRDLRRVTGDPRELADVTLAQLQELRLLGGEASDERVPTLAEFLRACGDSLRLNIELKETSRFPHLAPAVAEILQAEKFTERAAVSCFQLPPLLQVRAIEPKTPIGAILTAIQGDVTRLPVDFLSLNQRLVQAELVRRARQHGKQVHVWTVNDRETALRMLDLGCDNLITSDPVLLRGIVDEYAELSDIERMLLRLRRWMRQ